MGTIAHGLVEPFIIQPCHAGGDVRRAQGLDDPLLTLTASNRHALVMPYLVRYHNNRPEVCARSLDEPLPVADCNDRYGLVCPAMQGLALDIRFRMLAPHELAAAMSIPADYVFHGTRSEKVKQIGNAWPARLSEQLCRQLLPERVAA